MRNPVSMRRSLPLKPVSGPAAILALLVGLTLTGDLPGGKPTGATAPRTISVEWRKDSFVPPEIRTMAENGSGLTVVNGSPDLLRGSCPRWSPNGQMIGGYIKNVGGDRAIMAQSATGGSEQVIITNAQFNAWNEARAGVSNSELQTWYTFNCWLGNDALVVSGDG